MTDGQTPQADPPNAPRPVWPAADPRMTTPKAPVQAPEEPRTVHHVLADLAAEVEGLWHSSPSGTESAVVRMRGHLRELRGLVDPKAAASRSA